MSHIVSEWAESHFPLYTAESIHSLYSTSNQLIYPINESLTVLIVIAGGKGWLNYDEHGYELVEGSVILLPANCSAALKADLRQPLHAYKLVIGTRERTRPLQAGARMQRSGVDSQATIQLFLYEPAIVSKVAELYIHRIPDSEARHLRNQILFYETLLLLVELQDSKHGAGEQPSVERSMTYMENNYSDKITRDQLAAIAGVSSSHYSILFKQLTSFSPSDYLSRVRIHRAKELLMSGSWTLRETAQKVGYKDEFYLSRRFKQQTGEPPSSYSRRSIQRVAVWLAPYSGHLHALGLEPAVIISESSEYLNSPDLELPQPIAFISTSCPIDQVKSLLIAHDIELIIAADQHLGDYGLNAGQLRVVAPVAEVSWMEMGWKEHLRLIARAIHRIEPAEQWLADFEMEETAARSLVQQSPIASEILTILVIKPDEIQVYGARNVGYVLYQSLGLQPPAAIREEINRHGDQFHSVSIELTELANYAGSRLFVIVFPDAKGSTAHSEAVFKSVYWSELLAVQQGFVHQLELDEWVPYNPVSIRLQLQRAVALFAGN